MKNKITFLYGLGDRKEYKSLFKYFNIPKINWNKSAITPPIGKVKILIGFSMGAILACEHAIKHKVETLVLCSMTTGVETLAKVRASGIIFLVGEKEKWVTKDMNRLGKDLKCDWRIIVIPKADHKIDILYRKAILDAIEQK